MYGSTKIHFLNKPSQQRGDAAMKGLFGKLILFIAGLAAVVGFSVNNATASVPDISNKSALYLEHGKQIVHDSQNWHSSHASHSSHMSHESHRSHQSGW